MSVVLVDDRDGSEEFVEPLCKMGLPAELCRLSYGDIAFEGRGSGSDIVDVGIEFKNLLTGDATSSIRTGRLSGTQLPGLTGKDAIYDYAFLVIEGEWRIDPAGRITKRTKQGWKPLHGNMTASEFTKKVLTMEVCTGLHPVYTASRTHTLHFVANLYRWFTDKSVDAHTSHLTPHNRPLGFLKLSRFREAVMKWPGVGFKLSAVAESTFGGSVRKAAAASVDVWARMQTTDRKGGSKRFGIKAAERLMEFLDGR